MQVLPVVWHYAVIGSQMQQAMQTLAVAGHCKHSPQQRYTMVGSDKAHLLDWICALASACLLWSTKSRQPA